MQTDTADSSKPFTWRRCIILCFAVLVATTLIGLWNPIWIAPPDYKATPLLYLFLMWLWVPVFIVCVLRCPVGKKLVAVSGMLALVVATTGLMPIVIRFFYLSTLPFDLLMGGECATSSTASNLVQYTCVFSREDAPDEDMLFDLYTITFEGLPNFPLVRLTGEVAESLR